MRPPFEEAGEGIARVLRDVDGPGERDAARVALQRRRAGRDCEEAGCELDPHGRSQAGSPSRRSNRWITGSPARTVGDIPGPRRTAEEELRGDRTFSIFLMIGLGMAFPFLLLAAISQAKTLIPKKPENSSENSIGSPTHRPDTAINGDTPVNGEVAVNGSDEVAVISNGDASAGPNETTAGTVDEEEQA